MTKELPCAGGFARVDKKSNRALYGSSVTAAQILDGAVQPPAEFDGLYAALNHTLALEEQEA